MDVRQSGPAAVKLAVLGIGMLRVSETYHEKSLPRVCLDNPVDHGVA